MDNVLNLSKKLINIPSITPDDKGCLDLIIPRLKKVGFHTEIITAGRATNLWARIGKTAPLICFVGHTDVVPTGPREQWTHDPFVATEKNGFLYGRGAADMKTGVAAMVVAVENFVTQHPNFNGSIALLITSAEEAFCEFGTPAVVKVLQQRHEKIDYCIVGEPSASKQVGDVMKIGRRGSLNARLTIQGKQGHIAYPQLADNPIHKGLAALDQLTKMEWDHGNTHFPPTSFQISNVQAGTGADNVIPGSLTAIFNFRFSPESTPEKLQHAVETILKQHQLQYDIHWSLSGMPFYCEDTKFINACQKAIHSVTQQTPELSTVGGTSDGRFIAPTGAQIIECGLVNATIHQIDEHVLISDIDKLVQIYQQILIELCI